MASQRSFWSSHSPEPFTLCLCREIIEELRSRLLHRRKIRQSYQYADERVQQHCRDLEAASRLVADLPKVRVVAREIRMMTWSSHAPSGRVRTTSSLATRTCFLLAATEASGLSRHGSFSIFSNGRTPASQYQEG